MKNFLYYKYAAVSLFSFLLLNTFSFSQNIDSTIKIYADKYGQERSYLQFDKSTYAPGETIWFKAYIMNGIFPSDDSKNFYVDWTDEKGALFFRTVSPVVDGTTNGQFDIPANFTGKYIHVKAYTKWMLNFDSSFLYNKDIRILNKTSAIAPAKITITPMLKLFPEGGDAIAGIKNKIAFKANDQWGRPIQLKGTIQNQKGEFIDSLHVQHDGMGYFFLTPKVDESFQAKWKDESGADHVTDLPAIKRSGISLQISLSESKRNFTIYATPDVATSLGKLNVIGTMYGHEVFKVAKNISTGIAGGVIPISGLPSGILTITVFDEQWNPLAERITYINNQEYNFSPEMEVQHWGLNKRAKNEIEITVPDSLQANLAVSVTDADIDVDSSNNIISHLLLSSEIKGQVYNPAYYFSNTSDSVQEDLDLVMLTHGWRRFKWENIVKGKLPNILYPKDTSYLTLSGKVYGVLPSEFRQGTIILVMSQKKKVGKIIMLPLEKDGTFNDPSFLIFDTVQVYYHFPEKRLSDGMARFLENLLPAFSNNTPAGSFTTADTSGNSRHYQLADEINKLLQQSEGKLLENVTITTKTRSPLDIMDQKYSSGMFTGGDGYQFDVVDDPTASSSTSIFYYLTGKVAGLQVNPNATPPTLQWRGGAPELFLNEVPTDAEMISYIAVSDVAYIKVFRPPFMGGFNGANGAIAIYTRRGDDIKPVPGKGLANNMVRGYTVIREFYSPNYSSFKPENEKKDMRTTLYWNPQVITSPGKNKVALSFYNNDVSRAFRVTIEGMTKDGQLTHYEQIME